MLTSVDIVRKMKALYDKQEIRIVVKKKMTWHPLVLAAKKNSHVSTVCEHENPSD